MTYPSTYEGFGNALLEAIYFRVPVVINRYSIYVQDIEPKGFKLLEMDGFITPQLVEYVRRVIEDSAYKKKLVITITALPVSITVMLPYAICCATILRPSPVNPLLKAKYLWPTPCQSFKACYHNCSEASMNKTCVHDFKPVSIAGNPA